MSCCGLQTVRTRFIRAPVLQCAYCVPKDIDCKPHHRTASSSGMWRPGQPTGMGSGWSLPMLTGCYALWSGCSLCLPDVPAVYPQWRQLVVAFGVSGVQVHDVRLVAAMRIHSVTHILTFNVIDFVRYAILGIVAVGPLTL